LVEFGKGLSDLDPPLLYVFLRSITEGNEVSDVPHKAGMK
jgi:hypothetical protein